MCYIVVFVCFCAVCCLLYVFVYLFVVCLFFICDCVFVFLVRVFVVCFLYVCSQMFGNCCAFGCVPAVKNLLASLLAVKIAREVVTGRASMFYVYDDEATTITSH